MIRVGFVIFGEVVGVRCVLLSGVVNFKNVVGWLVLGRSVWGFVIFSGVANVRGVLFSGVVNF